MGKKIKKEQLKSAKGGALYRAYHDGSVRLPTQGALTPSTSKTYKCLDCNGIFTIEEGQDKVCPMCQSTNVTENELNQDF